MSSSREGFDLFHKAGRYHFGKYFPYLKWNLVFEDTFAQIGCWLLGHNKYDCSDMNDNSELGCYRCHKYIREKK